MTTISRDTKGTLNQDVGFFTVKSSFPQYTGSFPSFSPACWKQLQLRQPLSSRQQLISRMTNLPRQKNQEGLNMHAPALIFPFSNRSVHKMLTSYFPELVQTRFAFISWCCLVQWTLRRALLHQSYRFCLQKETVCSLQQAQPPSCFVLTISSSFYYSWISVQLLLPSLLMVTASNYPHWWQPNWEEEGQLGQKQENKFLLPRQHAFCIMTLPHWTAVQDAPIFICLKIILLSSTAPTVSQILEDLTWSCLSIHQK